MNIEVSDTVLLLPIGNMIGNVVAFKSMDMAVGDKVVLFPCEVTEGFEYLVACKPLSKEPLCHYALIGKVVVVPVGGDKDYLVVLAMLEEKEELELKFTEPWEVVCAEHTLQFTEIWEGECPVGISQHIEPWEI